MQRRATSHLAARTKRKPTVSPLLPESPNKRLLIWAYGLSGVVGVTTVSNTGKCNTIQRHFRVVVGFNGNLQFHETKDFIGERYTIIYYKQKWEGKIGNYITKGL